MIYPLFVITVAVIITYLMLTIVVPEFESMFKNFNAELPWFTQQILSISHWLRDNWLTQISATFSIVVLFRLLLKYSDYVQLHFDQLLLSLPIIGSALSKSIIARYSRTLAVNMRCGVPIISSLRDASTLAGNLFYKKNFEYLYQEITTGIPIYIAMKKTQCFPDIMIQMIMVGEESGKLDHMLDKIADIYEKELDDVIDKLGILVEPFLIVVLGTLIGSLVIAIYLPIFNMMNILG